MTVTGMTLEQNLNWWRDSERRRRFRQILAAQDGVDPDEVIMSPDVARGRGLGSTLIFPQGNLAPQGSVVKATAIDPGLWAGASYDYIGRARVFVTEDQAIEAVKAGDERRLVPGDVLVLLCRGPLGAGMPETAQITIALKSVAALRQIPLLTDGRFSGFSSGPCIGHIGPEALAGGPIGKLRDGDRIRIQLDRNRLQGRLDLIGDATTPIQQCSPELGTALLAGRPPRPDLRPDPNLPSATRLWAALQQACGGVWGGCVYDVSRILELLGQQ